MPTIDNIYYILRLCWYMQTIANNTKSDPERDVQIGINLSKGLVSKLDERARNSGNRSRSSVIREILTKELEA